MDHADDRRCAAVLLIVGRFWVGLATNVLLLDLLRTFLGACGNSVSPNEWIRTAHCPFSVSRRTFSTGVNESRRNPT